MTKLAITFDVPGIEVTNENHRYTRIIGHQVYKLIAILWVYGLFKIQTCMEVEVKKPNNRIMGSAEVYVEQHTAMSSNPLR